MKIIALHENGSKAILTCYILNDDEDVPVKVAEYAEAMGYKMTVHPVSMCSKTPLAFLASVQEEIEAYEND